MILRSRVLIIYVGIAKRVVLGPGHRAGGGKGGGVGRAEIGKSYVMDGRKKMGRDINCVGVLITLGDFDCKCAVKKKGPETKGGWGRGERRAEMSWSYGIDG